jgi:PTS system nitrogen regulatory IIA component
VIGALPGATPAVRQLLGQRVQAPDGIAWAPVGDGLALPHLRAHAALGRDAGILAVVLLRDGMVPAADTPPDGAPIRQLLFFVAPSPRAHLEILSRLSRALTQGGLRDALTSGAPDAAILAAMAQADRQSDEKEIGG